MIDPLLTVGVDVGGTKIACVVTDSTDSIIYSHTVPTDRGRLPSQVAEVASVATRNPDVARRGEVRAIGVAVPGQVEPRAGLMNLAVNLGGANGHLAATVETATGLPCYLEHDARAAAQWVYEHTAAPSGEPQDLAYISIGTGIAAGIVLGGRVLSGESGFAGEIGHALADPNGPRCACGLSGCLEAVAAGPAIARAAHEAAASGAHIPTTLTNNSTAADVFAAADAGDPAAHEIATRVGCHLARAIRSLVFTLGVRRIVIGGGVAMSGDSLLKYIRAALALERDQSRLVEVVFATTTIGIIAPGEEPGARGAAFIARRALLDGRRTESRGPTAVGKGVGDW
jgi:glucokinase